MKIADSADHLLHYFKGRIKAYCVKKCVDVAVWSLENLTRALSVLSATADEVFD